MTTTTTPQLAVTRVFDAPRTLVYQAFTEPDRFAQWWGPVGNSLPRDEIEFDVRPGGHQRWTEVFPADPNTGVRIQFDLAQVVDGELLEGTMRVTGQLPGGYQPFDTKLRLEFHDEGDGRTRVEVRQWLSEDLVAPSTNGWDEAFSKLEAALAA
ncbi:MAG TPA: SRPBCC domain-containing protein [Candidatus Limnocylindria bacterium]|jgi:uncharacterized protein YndB with AHSA1/START domain